MKARVTVTLKAGILDPQGKAIEGALKSLGVGGIASVRQGKVFDIELDGGDKVGVEAALKEAAEKLLIGAEWFKGEEARHMDRLQEIFERSEGTLRDLDRSISKQKPACLLGRWWM